MRRSNPRRRAVAAAMLLSGALALVNGSSRAQSTAPGPPAPSSPPAAPAAATPMPAATYPAGVTTRGYAIGSFLLNSAVQFTEQYDNNIFATPRDRITDFINVLTPSLDLESQWKRHWVNFDAGGAFARYDTHTTEDYNDYHLGGRGRLDLSDNANIFGGTTFWHAHEPRESPDSENGIFPTTYNRVGSHLGFADTIGKFSMRIGATRDRYDFDNTPTIGGMIDNKDRDRSVYEVGGRFAYIAEPDTRFFVQAAHNWRDYDLQFDNFGFRHASNGEAVAVGMAHTGSDWLTGEFFAGYLSQRYQDPRFAALTVPDFGGNFRVRLSPFTTFSGDVDRTVEETIVPGAASYLRTLTSMRIDHALRRDLTVNASAGYEVEDFNGVSRTDQIRILGAGIKYFFLPQVYVGADYQWQRRDSNEPIARYDESQVFVHVGAQLARGYDETTREPPQDQGFYGGIQTGHDALTTKLTGPRGGGGSLNTDFSGFGFTGGAFGGYGATIGHVYLGGEFEIDGVTAKWDHAHIPGARVFSPAEQYNFGASGRLGYVLDQGSLVYGRLGIANAGFLTYYSTPKFTLNQSNHQTGFRIGGGIETPISRRWWLRLDYTHTDYNDYDVSTPSGLDNFTNSDELVRFGLIYRLYDQTLGNQNTDPTPATIYDGFYAGVQAGYGPSTTLDIGPREGGTTLIANRGSPGPAGGGFAGYGLTWRRLYFGGECDLGGSGQSSGMERGPNKRDYNMSKAMSFGASARLGYVLDPGALVYARLGPIISVDDTSYAAGGGAPVQQENTQLGWRIGGGIEVPAGNRLFMRFDYAYSEYGKFEVNYHSGVDSFKNTDSLFQIGLAYRF